MLESQSCPPPQLQGQVLWPQLWRPGLYASETSCPHWHRRRLDLAAMQHLGSESALGHLYFSFPGPLSRANAMDLLPYNAEGDPGSEIQALPLTGWAGSNHDRIGRGVEGMGMKVRKPSSLQVSQPCITLRGAMSRQRVLQTMGQCVHCPEHGIAALVPGQIHSLSHQANGFHPHWPPALALIF